MSDIILTVAAAVLALGLAVSCMAVSLMAVLTVRWYRTQLSSALELVIRHQDSQIEYQRKSVADATAAGRIPPSAPRADVQSQPNTLANRAAQLLASEAAEGEDVV